MKKIESVCIFCGSSFGENPLFKAKAEALGKLIAEEKLTLVFGGSRLGLMGVIADTVMKNGGNVFGVIPEHLFNKGISHDEITELIVVKTMNERKALMIEKSDAFIAMPGGYGTLDEITEVLSLNQLSMIDKPCALFNVSNFYDNYIRHLEHTVEQKLLRPEHHQMLLYDDNEKRLLEKIKNYKTIDIGKWY
ncbi:MAG TPA: TIGR00730 family Rossman fold protein [Bacteroidales bacterium]|nr:TIGR00730 family Rossman fold protein [Bacteroidales bacterium]HPS16247.1 TIGR00730 family Rossman fold protein [Bacteroidales bacterium]